MNVYEKKSMRERLQGNAYAGRGIVVGMSGDGKNAVFAYFIMGRSDNSRNRVFIENGEDVVIHPFDPSKVEDPSLIIYSPIRVHGNDVIVTNGDQTDTVYDGLDAGKSFGEALNSRCFEPDAPNFTPRISGILHMGTPYSYEMNILKSADELGTACVRETFAYPALPGVGHFLHTYVCDGNPLPTFVGEPERVSVPDDIDAFTKEIWESLNEQNKISLYVRYLPVDGGKPTSRMINKFVK